MTTNKKSPNQQKWIQRLFQLSTYVQGQAGDRSNDIASKFMELAKKADKNELAIAFCGHFSAGKSSMINALMEEEFLPTSPIPTSANVVTMKDGEPSVWLKDHAGNIQYLPGELDLDTIKQASKNGEAIQSIEIHQFHPYLKDSTVIMDTPGIDSVDDAHKVSTESMLHLADVIVYVMDYNHVQSELNFTFTKKMLDLGKELVLIINQIDKHDETELPFTDYKTATIDAFRRWGVEPAGIFFTAIRNIDVEHNQLEALKQELLDIKGDKHSYIERTLNHMTKSLIEDHLLHVYPNIEELKSQSDDSRNLERQAAQRTEEKQAIRSIFEREEERFRTSLDKIIANARVIPYDVRDLGKDVLQSLKDDFKTGILFSKKKTEAEREDRIDRYVNAVNDKVSTELEWHVKEELFSFLKNLELNDPGLEADIHNLTTRFTTEDVHRLRQQGATFNEAYVLQYNRDVEDAMKRSYRRLALDIIDKAKEHYFMKKQSKLEQLEQELLEITTRLERVKERTKTINNYEQEWTELNGILEEEASTAKMDEAINWYDRSVEEEQQKVTLLSETKFENEQRPFPVSSEIPSEKRESEEKDVDLGSTISKLEVALETLSNWSSMEDLTRRMQNQIEKINQREFTVALFGAFSAGKSSFANAWMKDDVLPVSPNPTTATINKIMPVTEENRHGTVKIHLKTVDRLLEEIQASLKKFGRSANTLAEAVQEISKIDTERSGPHESFLSAVQGGFEAMEQYLGTVQVLDHTSFTEFVSKEDRACFTESVELFYDCELTRHGITLVDTPGADSINARHTSVAFEYIKNADAIVFVTYYNHAFSNADRDFLLQLGRVKDTFSMDKMYFVINAADLATDEQEREDVIEYVQSQLVEYGIRHPRMFALSSKRALIERKGDGGNRESHFETFEQSFQTETIKERDLFAKIQADQLLKNGVERISEWIERAHTDETKRDQEMAALRAEQEAIVHHIRTYSFESFGNMVAQETKELLHYVIHRLGLVFNDEFKQAFNPAVLTKDMKRDQLALCLEELLDRMKFQLSQELRATSLRIERVVNTQRERFYKAIDDFAVECGSKTRLMAPDEADIPTPEIAPQWPSDRVVELKPALKAFRSPKQFFEQNGKEQIREDLLERFKPILDEVVGQFAETFVTHYLDALGEEEQMLRNTFEATVHQYYRGLIEAYTSTDRLEELEQAKEKLVALTGKQEGVNHEQ